MVNYSIFVLVENKIKMVVIQSNLFAVDKAKFVIHNQVWLYFYSVNFDQLTSDSQSRLLNCYYFDMCVCRNEKRDIISSKPWIDEIDPRVGKKGWKKIWLWAMSGGVGMRQQDMKNVATLQKSVSNFFYMTIYLFFVFFC